MNIDVGMWDVVLVLGVAVQGTVLSFVHHPKWKAFLLCIPIPFTLANLSLAIPVGANHAAALPVLLLFAHGVRWLHVSARVPIVPAIAVSAAGYCVIATGLVRVIPDTDAAFWGLLAMAYVLGWAVYILTSHRAEPGHRSPLPVPVKFVAVVCVVIFLVAIKGLLKGFMTLFPMVTTVAAYEARHSLWTMCRQIPVVIVTAAPMLAAMRLTQPRLGFGAGLAVGWVVFILALSPFMWRLWRGEPA